MAVQVNHWEDGSNEGKFDTLAEAKEYVLENDMDVMIHDYSTGRDFRFSAEILEREKKDAEYQVDQLILGYPTEES